MPSMTSLTDRYLDSLGLQREAPTLPYLSSIVAAHIGSYAFSSLGPQLGDELPLQVDALFDRIVERRRGGYCFEQNGLLFPVLQELGFDARLLLARVVLSGAEHPGLTHRISLVELDGVPYVADVGFGPTGPPVPVPMPGFGGASCETHRVVEHRQGQFHLEQITAGVGVPQYRFEVTTYGQSDCELGHFFSHRHPDAMFVNNLVASLILPGEIRSLRNLEHRVMTDSGEHRVVISDSTQLCELLRSEYDLAVTDDEGARLFTKLAKLAPPT